MGEIAERESLFQNIFTIQNYLLNNSYLNCRKLAAMNSKPTLLLTIIILLLSQKSFAQKEANIWYFGSYGGVDFNSGAPVVLTNSAMSAFEGCTSIANHNGQLLFYTDG